MTATDDWPNARPRVRLDVEVVDVGDEKVVWDPLRDRVHRLDPVGALMWPFLDGATTLNELAADAADIWNIEIDVALAALVSLVEGLLAADLLTDSEFENLGRASAARDGYLSDPPVP